MTEHVVPVDKQLSDDLEQYFALTTSTELPASVRRVSSWRLSERQRRRSVWRAGAGVLAGAAALAAVLVLTLHPGGSSSPQVASTASGAASVGSAASGGGLTGVHPAYGPNAGTGFQGHPAAGQALSPINGLNPPAQGGSASVPPAAGTTVDGSVPAPAPANAAASSSAPAIVIGGPTSGHLERSVTAAYTVSPGSFLGSFEDVSSRAVSLGGYVASSNTQPDKSGRIVAGTVSLKVPAAKLTDFLNGMPSGFVASSINFASVDHTAQFVDVTARLTSARARLDAVNALLPKATSLADIATLEKEVETAQIEIDTYQGDLNALKDSVDMATATISLSERGSAAAVATPPPPPVSSGFSTGWDNAVHVTGAIAEGIVSALPVIVLALVVLLLGWWRWGRGALARRRSGAAA
jgi:hypothetical protein